MVQRLHGSVGHCVRGSGFYKDAKVIYLGATTQKATNISFRAIDSAFSLFDTDINSDARVTNWLINQYCSILFLLLDYAYKKHRTISSEIPHWVQTNGYCIVFVILDNEIRAMKPLMNVENFTILTYIAFLGMMLWHRNAFHITGLCEWNPPVDSHHKMPVMWSCNVSFMVSYDKPFKHSYQWFETP